jgi:hypothetical protein
MSNIHGRALTCRRDHSVSNSDQAVPMRTIFVALHDSLEFKF